MRISVISTPVFRILPPPYYTKGYAGLEVIAAQIAYGLAQRGHAVRLYAPDGSECPGVEVIQIGPERISEKMAYSGFPAFTDGKGNILRPRHYGYWQQLLDSDCVIDHSWGKHSYLLKAEGALKAPVLGVFHAPIPTMVGSPPPVEKPCVVCISQDQASHYESLFSPQRARVAHNGVDPSMYAAIPGVKRTNRFLFLARFSTIKGPSLAIEACKEAGVGLDLVGDTSITNEPEYLARCQSMCDGEQIRMVGACTRGEAVRWFSQAHCMLHPNFPCREKGMPGFREPYGLAPVESMLAGCPVIAGNYGALRETMHPDLCWLVSNYPELVERVKDVGRGLFDVRGKPKHREEVREWAMQFSVDNMVRRYETLCEEALSGGW